MQTAPSSKDRSDRFLELLRLYFKHSSDDDQLEDDHKDNNNHNNDNDNDNDNNDNNNNNLNQQLSMHDDDDLDFSSHDLAHAKAETLNLSLLQEALEGGDDEFAFMASINESGMDFNFDEDGNGDDNDDIYAGIPKMSDNFIELPEDHEMFQIKRIRSAMVTRNRAVTRRGAISVGSVTESDALRKLDNGIDKQLFFEKGVKYYMNMHLIWIIYVFYNYYHHQWMLSFRKYILKIIPYVVHKKRMKQIKKIYIKDNICYM